MPDCITMSQQQARDLLDELATNDDFRKRFEDPDQTKELLAEKGIHIDKVPRRILLPPKNELEQARYVIDEESGGEGPTPPPHPPPHSAAVYAYVYLAIDRASA